MINSNHVDYLEIQKELIEKVYDIFDTSFIYKKMNLLFIKNGIFILD